MACVFLEERWKLGPRYYCPTCELPDKDLNSGCPKCPLTQLYQKTFKTAAIEEIERRGGLADGTTVDRLMNDYWSIAVILSDNDDRINEKWDVAFVALARIVLQERAQQKFINDWNDWRKITLKK